MENLQILQVAKKPILSPGELGMFDDSGTMMSCIQKIADDYYLYYIGWNLGVTVPFRNSIGLAKSEDGLHFERAYRGPILDRTNQEPNFCASSWVLPENDGYRMWYLSCVNWIHDESGACRHRYHIKDAYSRDGITWERHGHVSIDFKDATEYAISRPCVIYECGKYRMWFSHRGERYRIGYAESPDGVTWERKDELAGITVSEQGFDSDMICYPCVFQAAGQWYMLYNGNRYGMTGFGIAKLVGTFDDA